MNITLTQRRVLRAWAAYHIGDPTWADEVLRVLADPEEAEAELRAEKAR